MINRIYPGNAALPHLAAPLPTTEKSLDLLIDEASESSLPFDMKEFGFKLLYNDWMQSTLLSDGLTAEDQVEW